MIASVSSWTSNRLVWTPIKIKEELVRATLETAPDKRPCKRAQAIFLCTQHENAGLAKDQFDMRWVWTEIRVCEVCPSWARGRAIANCLCRNWGLLGAGPRKVQ